jgi:WD40 repeat protein
MKIKTTFSGHNEDVICIRNLSSSVFATGSEDNTARIWDLKSKFAIRAITGFPSCV